MARKRISKSEPTATRVAVGDAMVESYDLPALELVTLSSDFMDTPFALPTVPTSRPDMITSITDENNPCLRLVRGKFIRLVPTEKETQKRIDKKVEWMRLAGALSIKVLDIPKPRTVSGMSAEAITTAIDDLEGISRPSSVLQVVKELVVATAIDDSIKEELLAYCIEELDRASLEGGTDVHHND